MYRKSYKNDSGYKSANLSGDYTLAAFLDVTPMIM